MSAQISSWVAHAHREPGDALMQAMESWWSDAVPHDPSAANCPWLSSPLHRLIAVHVDRAAHKRRHLPVFVSSQACGHADHGDAPMSAIVKDDNYGAHPMQVVHSAPVSALSYAISSAKDRDATLAVPLVTESQFEDADHFDEHRAALLSPLRDGVVLAVIHAPLNGKENLDDEIAREDLLRAAGYAAYTLDLSREEESKHLHKRTASLIEDIFDEIAQIKADAGARILMSEPLWPALVIRTLPEWRALHGNPLVTGEVPLLRAR